MYNVLNAQQDRIITLEEEWRTCADSPGYFIWNYIKIKHPDYGIIPFELWEFQLQDLQTIIQNQVMIVLKARQLGLTTLLCAYALWLMMFHSAKEVVVISKGERESTEVISRIKIMYGYLPKWMKNRIKCIQDNNEIFALSNHSIARSFPAKGGAGRSFSCSLLIMDEAAFMPEAKEIYSGARPTLGRTGKIVIISTGNGKDNWYHEMWQKASIGRGDDDIAVVAIFHPWWVHPDRDEAWYKKETKLWTNIEEFKQEYPAHEHEAFILKKGRFFKEFGSGIHAKEIIEFEPEYELFRAIDFGFAQGATCLWIQVDSMDSAAIIHELMVQEYNSRMFADAIMAEEVKLGFSSTGTKDVVKEDYDDDGKLIERIIRVPAVTASIIVNTFADPAGKQRGYSGISPYMELEDRNIICQGEKADKLDGVDEIRKWLKNTIDGSEGAQLLVSRDCINTIAMFEGLERDKNNSEYYSKDGTHDHTADALKYFFRNRFMFGSLPMFSTF